MHKGDLDDPEVNNVIDLSSITAQDPDRLANIQQRTAHLDQTYTQAQPKAKPSGKESNGARGQESNGPTLSAMDQMIADLAKSGLTYGDMRAGPLDESSRAACNVSQSVMGYIMPYTNMWGARQTFYRCKLLDYTIKYMQVKNTSNHVYFPFGFYELFVKTGRKYVVITEGEKKAALAVKMGIPAVAFGGVDSWQNKTIQIPKASEISQPGGAKSPTLSIKLPSANFDETFFSVYAIGLQDLMDECLKYNTTFFITYDSDNADGVGTAPQRAAARLGYEIRYKGFKMSQIRQIILPSDGEKVGLDDFLLDVDDGGPARFMDILHRVWKQKGAFPKHPSIREHIAKQLQRRNLDRKQWQNLSLALITELDARGSRMYSKTDMQMYYFNGTNNNLMKVDINKPNISSIHEAAFGMMLYSDYSISPAADINLMKWLGTQFSGEQPLEMVEPHRVIARAKPKDDCVRFQISNGEYIKVIGHEDPNEAFQIMNNGSEGTLFESEMEDGIDPQALMQEIKLQLSLGPVKNRWHNVMKEVRLKFPGKQALLTSFLYYLSPYLLRWRGMQLPVEIVTGEAGSGKSTLYEIRLRIISGDPKLRNTPENIKDWYASISNNGGLHITDNVHMTDKNLKQRMSDELCRLVTDPDPRIEMRKYFTEADQRTIRINSVFGFTAIQQPFMNSDVLQRAMLLELEKGDEAEFDSQWKDKQITKYGGRIGWVAHQMIVLREFFLEVEKSWNPSYRSKNRLVNLEQSMLMLANVFGVDGSWIPEYLANSTNDAISKADWALEGLKEYADEIKREYTKAWTFEAQDIAKWAKDEEDYKDCYQLTQSRALGKYLVSNRQNVAKVTGIVVAQSKNNKLSYRVLNDDDKRVIDAIPPKTKDATKNEDTK